MDLKFLDAIGAAEKGLTFNILDGSNDPTDITISVVGVGSRTYKEAKKKLDSKRKMADKARKVLTEEENEQMYAELAAACTTGWTNIQQDGKDVPFSYEVAVEVYTKYPFVSTQVVQQIGNLEEMMGNLNSNSKGSAK